MIMTNKPTKANLEPSTIPAPVAVPAANPEMAAMLALMTSMQAEMKELKAVKTPEAIQTPSQMAQRQEAHNEAMIKLVNEQKERFRIAYQYDFADSQEANNGEVYATMLFTIRTVEQSMWTLSNTHAKQWFWTRKGGDKSRLKLFQLSDKYNHQRNRSNNSSGVDSDSAWETDMSPHKDYERAEQNVDYYAAEELPNQVIAIAARELWDEIVGQRRLDHQQAGGTAPFKEPNEPYFNPTESAYIEWLEGDASKRELDMLKGSEAALETSRLAYYARTLETKLNK
jgi:hypothetical protein